MFATGRASPPMVFQTYLLPNLPFGRRQSSSNAVTTAGSVSYTSSSFSTSPTSGSSVSSNYSFCPTPAGSISQPQPRTYLSGSTSHISCGRCHADLALTSQIISKGFTGRHGRAYLVAGSTAPFMSSPSKSNGSAISTLPNTHTHKAMPRHLVTGLHTVCDISCALCGGVLGWKYVSAEEESQRYKVGKFILETRWVTVGSCWENEDEKDSFDEDDEGGVASGVGAVDDVTFDSQDEDECEDLFAGIWSPQLAKRRRGRRIPMRPGA